MPVGEVSGIRSSNPALTFWVPRPLPAAALAKVLLVNRPSLLTVLSEESIKTPAATVPSASLPAATRAGAQPR